MAKQVLLTNQALRGVEYGILRDFEDEIVGITGAERLVAPHRVLHPFINDRLEHGTRYARLRPFVPKKAFALEADVLWVVLMGPENFTLDLFDGWDKNVGTKILYIFDTFECHLNSILRVLAATKWDYTFTAFQGAKTYLERHTGRRWHLVHQGVNLDRFSPVDIRDRSIGFCSYGRQLEKIHQSIKEHCSKTSTYYDFNTTLALLAPNVSPQESYARYAWHLGHSFFNFCWPLDLTHPGRVKTFSPISPRYFEAAASGNIMIGQKPTDPHFDELFGADAVVPIDPEAAEQTLAYLWSILWQNRESYYDLALKRRESLSHKWSWESRVQEILAITKIPASKHGSFAA
jgi:hypothetical protein